MLFSIAGCVILDYIVEIDLVFFFQNKQLKTYFGRIGIASLFSIILFIWNFNIFKNMIRCKIPLPN